MAQLSAAEAEEKLPVNEEAEYFLFTPPPPLGGWDWVNEEAEDLRQFVPSGRQ